MVFRWSFGELLVRAALLNGVVVVLDVFFEWLMCGVNILLINVEMVLL